MLFDLPNVFCGGVAGCRPNTGGLCAGAIMDGGVAGDGVACFGPGITFMAGAFIEAGGITGVRPNAGGLSAGAGI